MATADKHDAGDTLRNPGATAPGGTALNKWYTPGSGDRPAWVEVEVYTESDGTSDGQVDIEVDENSDGTADDAFSVIAPAGLGATMTESHMVYVPDGGQYRFNNVSDPNGNNTTNTSREIAA